MTKKLILILILFLCNYVMFSQNKQKTILTLNDCLEIAIKNNLELKANRLNTESSEINYKQSKAAMLPTLNMDYNLGVNNGRSIDPYTNNYINKGLAFSSAGLFLDFNVFNGFRLKNEVKQNRFDIQASEMETEEATQNLILEVTLQYIQILNNRDMVELSKSKLQTTETQLNRLKINYNEGAGNPVDYTDMLGQFTLDQISIIEAENSLKTAIISLAKLINIDIGSDITFENISGLVGMEIYQFSPLDIYNDALQNLATFKSRQFRIDATIAGIKVAESNYYPRVSLFGQLNTNYSSLANIINRTGSSVVQTGDFVNVGNQEYSVLRNEAQFESKKIEYNRQFKNNLNSVVGISVRVPLFNGFRAKNSVSLQKIQVMITEGEMEQSKFDFKQSIEDDHNNMESAYMRYQIFVDQLKAYEESFRVNEVRFNNGVSNIVDYITSKNNMDVSRLNLNKTKYEYLLRVKILEYYRGI